MRTDIKEKLDFDAEIQIEEFRPYYVKRLTPKTNKRSKWTQTQHLNYVKFIAQNRDFFETEKTRREKRVFFRAAKWIKTKICTQIKSHHQKMMTKYENNIETMIQCYLGQERRQNVKIQCELSSSEDSPHAMNISSKLPSLIDQQDLQQQLLSSMKAIFEVERQEEEVWARMEEYDIDNYLNY